MDNRATSTSLDYALTLGISTVLVVGLLLAGGTFVETQRAGVVDSELRVLGQRLAGDIATADRIVQSSSGSTDIRITTHMPERVAGSMYSIEVVTDDGNASLRLETHQQDRSVIVPVANRTAVAPGTISNADVAVVYTSSTPAQMEVRNA